MKLTLVLKKDTPCIQHNVEGRHYDVSSKVSPNYRVRFLHVCLSVYIRVSTRDFANVMFINVIH